MITLRAPLQKHVAIAAAAFGIAAAAFWATVLVSPPTSQAAVNIPGSGLTAITTCEYLPTGDISHCTVQP
jgi:hypothetical protein